MHLKGSWCQFFPSRRKFLRIRVRHDNEINFKFFSQLTLEVLFEICLILTLFAAGAVGVTDVVAAIGVTDVVVAAGVGVTDVVAAAGVSGLGTELEQFLFTPCPPKNEFQAILSRFRETAATAIDDISDSSAWLFFDANRIGFVPEHQQRSSQKSV